MFKTKSDDYYSPGKDYFAFNLKLLFLVGLWPNENWSKTQKIAYKFYQIILNILPIVYNTLTFLGTYLCFHDLTKFLANVDKNVVAMNFTLKYILFYMKQKKISVLINEIMNSGDQITRRCNRLITIHVIGTAALTTFIVTFFIGVSLVNTEVLVEAWMPFDQNKNFQNALLANSVLCTIIAPATLSGSFMQGIVCCLIMYLCEQLIELQNRIRELKYEPGNEDVMKYEFKEFIKKHIRIMGYSNTLRDILNEFLFIQNLAVTVELCLNAVMITLTQSEEKRLLLGFITFLSAALINAFIYCYLGNQLITQSEGIAEAAYDSTWTSWPVGMQRDLSIVIMVAQKSLSLIAGGIGTLSMKMFGQALYNGYSIFAVLNDVVD